MFDLCPESFSIELQAHLVLRDPAKPPGSRAETADGPNLPDRLATLPFQQRLLQNDNDKC
eukprot:4950944-Amphidinium_carterae.1